MASKKKNSKKNKNSNKVSNSVKQEENSNQINKTSESLKNETKKEKTKNEPKEETKEEKVVFKDKTENKEKKDVPKKETSKNIEAKEMAKAEVLETKEKSKRKIMASLIIVITILVVILAFSTTFAMIHSTKNTIAKGVKIQNISVSGLTYDEAKKKLDEAFKTLLDVNIELSKDDYLYKIKPEDVEFSYDFKKELDEAYSIGRKGNIIQCNYDLIAKAIIPKNIKIDYKFNKDDVNSIVDDISTNIPNLVTQYSHYIEGDNLIITPGVDGIQVEKEELKKIIENNLKNRNPLEIIKEFKNVKLKIPYKNVKADEIDIDKIYSEVHTEPQDAYFVPATETEKAKIFADVDGVDFAISIDEVKEKLKEKSDEYIIPISKKKASVTINDIGLEAFPDKIQEFSTRYDASLRGRSENLRIATSKIDGTVLMPGQQFSFNGVVGERTVQEGYKNAAIYEGGGVVDGLAGGICQISSTLYNAALFSNLQIDERYNHSFKTSYLGVGRDATVVYGIKDFKFTNNRSYPIKIEGSAENGVVTFAIYGIKEETEYKINIIPVVTSTIPYTTETIQDNSLKPGTQEVVQAGASGYKATTYKEKVLNGAVVSKEVISNDTYKAMTRIVKVGPAVTSVPTTPSTPTPEAPSAQPEVTPPQQQAPSETPTQSETTPTE